MSLHQTLLSMNLTKYESEAYIYILQNGTVEASEISKETNIPYGKIYETLNKLENYGFIQVQNSRPKKYQSIQINIAIEAYLSKKQNEINEKYQQLKQQSNTFLDQVKIIDQPGKKEKIFWRTALGDDIHDLYLSSVKEAKSEIYMFSPHTSHDLKYVEKFHDHNNEHDHDHEENNDAGFIQEIKLSLQKGVGVKVLYSGTHECKHFRKMFEPFLNEIIGFKFKVVPYEIVTTPLIILDESIVIFDIVDPLDSHSTLGITKVYDKQLCRKIRGQLEKLWVNSMDYLELYPKKINHNLN